MKIYTVLEDNRPCAWFEERDQAEHHIARWRVFNEQQYNYRLSYHWYTYKVRVDELPDKEAKRLIRNYKNACKNY